MSWIHMSALKHGITFGLLLIATFSNAQDFYKWVDKNGTTHYTKTPPPQNAKKADSVNTYVSQHDAVRYGPTNNYSNSNASPWNNEYGQSNSYSGEYQNHSATQRRASDEDARKAAIRAASTPIAGARGLTAAQRQTVATLSGGDSSGGGYSEPSRTPSTITNCDGVGCWGSDGTRYNQGAGNTYFPSNGGSCQRVGGQMQCN